MTTNNASFTLQFCPYPQSFTNCINVAPINAGASFSVNENFTFPAKGTFSGAFQIVDSAGDQSEVATTGTTGTSFTSALLPAATVTGGIGQTTGNSPGFGSAAVHGKTPHITLTGAFPNHTFTVALCSLFPQNPCQTLGNITTNVHGDASADVGTAPPPSAFNVFRLSDSSGVQFVTAFRVE